MSSSEKVVAAIQVRLASTRLARKALAPIDDWPMTVFTAERLRSAENVDQVVVATTSEASDDELVAALARHGLMCYRGSRDDLVARLLGAATLFGAQVLVRVWGDCPLVDPQMVDDCVRLLRERNLDFADTGLIERSRFPLGLDVEVYRRRTLERMNGEARSAFHREFPIEFLKEHREEYRSESVRCEVDATAVSVTVDYAEDLELVRAVWQRLGGKTPSFGWRDIWELHSREPELFATSSKHGRNLDFKRKQEQAR